MCFTTKEEMRKVIYTSIVGDYDPLPQPEVVDEGFDYICFSDDIKEDKAGVWTIRPIPYSNKDSTRLSRYVKLLPHVALPDYDVSVWIDANIRITGKEFYDVVNDRIASGVLMAQVPHPQRDCVYEEISMCYKDLRIGLCDALRQRRHLKKEGFPRHFGMMENNLILRRHNDPVVRQVSDGWWREYLTYSIRDQLSLMPVCWKSGFRPELLLGEGKNARNVPYLEIMRHYGRRSIVELKGVRRWPMKFRWTFRAVVVKVLFREK